MFHGGMISRPRTSSASWWHPQISRGCSIVTDRLHVHICSLLLGRPHAVLDNSYGKVRRFMSALSDGTDLSYKATSLADGIAWARSRAGRGNGE
jgi:exopolysaccharide biosynthesis predicted pyruvyltransferase EpsI